ncbi:protein gurken-like isoform X2 [Mya arenaria]|uniref:protein gurken-like isoform X2 n=1 Tax=Mya arenaria TaxID=6604 RepID=UPI0022DEB004|nr:protein gurken-like isoform X2 [Mya arenaria]
MLLRIFWVIIACVCMDVFCIDLCDRRKCDPKYCRPLNKCDFEDCRANGCGRVPATPPPTTPLIPTEPTINGSVRSVRCTEAEVNETACLNGGTCFAMWLSDDERVSSCHCNDNYEGLRCEKLDFDSIFPSTDDPVARAGIAASIAVLIIITVVFVAVAILYYRRKRREREAVERNKDASQEPLQSNGLNGLPENHVCCCIIFTQDNTETMGEP